MTDLSHDTWFFLIKVVRKKSASKSFHQGHPIVVVLDCALGMCLAGVRQVGFRSSVSGTGRTKNCFVTAARRSRWHEEQAPERQGR
jgi:hypothetical protein